MSTKNRPTPAQNDTTTHVLVPLANRLDDPLDERLLQRPGVPVVPLVLGLLEGHDRLEPPVPDAVNVTRVIADPSRGLGHARELPTKENKRGEGGLLMEILMTR